MALRNRDDDARSVKGVKPADLALIVDKANRRLASTTPGTDEHTNELQFIEVATEDLANRAGS